MGFFSRKKKENASAKAAPTVSEAEKRDETLREAINFSLGSGARDNKILVVNFADKKDALTLYIKANHVMFASLASLPLDVPKFFDRHENLDSAVKDKLLTFSTEESAIASYHEVTQEPKAKEILDEALKAHTLNSLYEASKLIPVKTIAVELLFGAKPFEGFDFYGLSLDEAFDSVDTLQHDVDKVLARWDATENWGAVTFDEVEDFSSDGVLRKLIFDASKDGLNLSELKELAEVAGFTWSETLIAMDDLNEEKKLTISSLSSEDEALPSVVDFGPPTEAISVVLPSDDDDDEWEYSKPPVNDEPTGFDLQVDEGGFDFIPELDAVEDLNPYLEDKTLTADLKAGLNEDADSFDEIIAASEKNDALEDAVRVVENGIEESQGKYNHKLGEFQNIALEQGIQRLEGVEVADEEELEASRVGSNAFFFDLEARERERYNLNVERRALLSSMALAVAPLEGDNVQELMNRIESKISGIDNVFNQAFHDPKDNRNLLAAAELIDEDEVQVEIFPEETPLYLSLMAKLDIDPLHISL